MFIIPILQRKKLRVWAEPTDQRSPQPREVTREWQTPPGRIRSTMMDTQRQGWSVTEGRGGAGKKEDK